MRVSNWRQNLHFWLNYPFRGCCREKLDESSSYILLLCSPEENRHRFGTTWRWVNNDNFYFGVSSWFDKNTENSTACCCAALPQGCFLKPQALPQPHTADFELLWGVVLGLWRLWSRPHCDAATLTLLPTRGEVDPSAVNSWINNTTGGFDKWGLIRQVPCQLSNTAIGKKEFERERQRDMGRPENHETRHFWIGQWVRKISVACPPFELRKFTCSKYYQQSWGKLLLKVMYYNIALLHKK